MTEDMHAAGQVAAGSGADSYPTRSQNPSTAGPIDQVALDLYADLEELSSLQERLAAKLSVADS